MVELIMVVIKIRIQLHKSRTKIPIIKYHLTLNKVKELGGINLQ
jgi:hypothetical protein